VNYDVIHYFNYNEQLKKNEFFIHKVKFHWPLPYSYRIQYLTNERYEGYYFPPLQRKKSKQVLPINSKKNKIKEEFNEEDGSDEERNEEEEDNSDDEDIVQDCNDNAEVGSSMEAEEEKSVKKWICIYREVKSSSLEDMLEVESRKRKSSCHDLRDDSSLNEND
jgi:hypothetical protein